MEPRDRRELADRPWTRRAVVTAAAAAAASLAGCLGGDDADVEIPDPQSVGESQPCSQCSMLIANYPGPTGQAYYVGDLPENHDGTTHFCSIDCLLTFDAERRRLGWEPVVYYLTDYSSVEYRIDDADAITRHLDAETFADAETLFYAVQTGIQGAMGDTPVPFSSEADADELIAEYGGTIEDWSSVNGT